MRLAVITLTKGGIEIGKRIFKKKEVDLFLPEKFAAGLEDDHVNYFKNPLRRLVANIFNLYDGLIFIMATGIVVRMIAPYIKDKWTDPAVAVIDEKGNFVISLLAGHMGGGNELAREIARILGAQPVITTATDVQGKIAFDMIAKSYALKIEPFANLKSLNAALVNEEKIGVFSEIPIKEELFPNVDLYPIDNYYSYEREYEFQVLITSNKIKVKRDKSFIFLRPKNLIIGIGCRRKTTKEKIIKTIEMALDKADKVINSVKQLSSIDIKKDEKGLVKAAEELGLPLFFYDRDEILSLQDKMRKKGVDLSSSNFVKEMIGVDGVCEQTALLGGEKTRLILRKMVNRGVAIAISQEELL